MGKIFKKKENTETEDKIELTPEEKKAKVKKTITDVCKTVGAVAAGAALTMAAVIGIGKRTANDSDELDLSDDGDLEEDIPEDSSEE